MTQAEELEWAKLVKARKTAFHSYLRNGIGRFTSTPFAEALTFQLEAEAKFLTAKKSCDAFIARVFG